MRKTSERELIRGANQLVRPSALCENRQAEENYPIKKQLMCAFMLDSTKSCVHESAALRLWNWIPEFQGGI
jgi:hypothetical protein